MLEGGSDVSSIFIKDILKLEREKNAALLLSDESRRRKVKQYFPKACSGIHTQDIGL